MPISLKRAPSGALLIFTLCEVSGCEMHACYGKDVHYRKALLSLEGGDKSRAKALLGRWYCRKHWKESAA